MAGRPPGKTGDESLYDHTAHGPTYRNFLRYMFTGAKAGMTPDQIADVLVGIVESPAPRPRYAPVAQKLTNWTLPRLLPERAPDRMMFKALGMKHVAE